MRNRLLLVSLLWGCMAAMTGQVVVGITTRESIRTTGLATDGVLYDRDNGTTERVSLTSTGIETGEPEVTAEDGIAAAMVAVRGYEGSWPSLAV